jgi:hypothetical protein
MPRTRPARRSEAFDPSETLRVHCGNGFDARFEPLSKHSFEPIQCCFLTLGKAMQRREFITLLGGTAAAWPLAARSQQSGRLPTIGFVGGATASAWTNWSAAFVQRLRELGWSEGRTVPVPGSLMRSARAKGSKEDGTNLTQGVSQPIYPGSPPDAERSRSAVARWGRWLIAFIRQLRCALTKGYHAMRRAH